MNFGLNACRFDWMIYIRGMELGMCLDIVKELNSGCELETAKTIIEEQGHSGMSFRLVCSMVKSFCDRGTDFVSYTRS